MEKKSLGYNLFVDEELSTLLTVFVNLYMDARIEGKFEGFELREQVDQTFTNFLDTNSDNVHKLGWCKDPNCEWKDEKTEE